MVNTMFSGIVEETGRVGESPNGDGRMLISAERVVGDARPGDSIAVDGACLTVTAVLPAGFSVDVMPETLQRTTLGLRSAGDAVNLERALETGERIGGHLVTGHVDGVGTVTAIRDDGNARWVTIDAPAEVLRMVAGKGSVAVDGISLTVVDVFDTAFTVSLIPHTLAVTTAGAWAAGRRVNLEVDLVARYVARAVSTMRDATVPEVRS